MTILLIPRRLLHVVFFGSDHFSLPHLQVLHNLCRQRKQAGLQLAEGTADVTSLPTSISSLHVVTSSPQTYVARYCHRIGQSVRLWSDLDPRDLIGYDVGVVASFGHLIPAPVICSFPNGIINIHPSLLPRWRGSSPLVYTILHGDRVTGITIMQVAAGRFDHGHIICQRSLPIPSNLTTGQLLDWITPISVDAMLEVLSDLDRYRATSRPQPSVGATVARKITPAMANICWERHTSTDIDRLHRALSDLYPLTTKFGDLPVKLFDPAPMEAVEVARASGLFPSAATVPPGTAVYAKRCQRNYFFVRCGVGVGDWCGFGRILIGPAVSSRRHLTALEFYCGYLTKPWYWGVRFESLANPLFK